MRIRLPANDVTPAHRTEIPSEAKALFEQLLVEQSRCGAPFDNFGEFERQLHARMAEIERKLLAEELQQQDVDVTVVQIEGVPYRRVLRCTETYMSTRRRRVRSSARSWGACNPARAAWIDCRSG
ncbi:hypothetical protein [Chondromyces crocatus]|uniref:hypothetical protein n=1 Tax=Chondromyces crocatus TaxID=52 RepID=UPI00067D7464|nr:hypothetical protein [Chondromyces crocatus]